MNYLSLPHIVRQREIPNVHRNTNERPIAITTNYSLVRINRSIYLMSVTNSNLQFIVFYVYIYTLLYYHELQACSKAQMSLSAPIKLYVDHVCIVFSIAYAWKKLQSL